MVMLNGPIRKRRDDHATNLRKHGIAFGLTYECDWTNAYFKPDRRFGLWRGACDRVQPERCAAMDSKKLSRPPPDFDNDAPELTDEEIKELRPAREWFEANGIPMPVPRGRPKADVTKQSVTLRIDPDVVDYFKAGGPGWQTRMNDVLAREMRKKRRS
jgi:uncharacterized protein (DUF4415 family)